MVKEELIIGDETVELLKSLNPNLTFNISDIANPDKRKSDYSKTIRLPASKKINKIFEHLFEVNLALQTFNPNLKTEVMYLVDGELNLDGFLQLKQINTIDKDDITYEVTLTGRVGDFISEISNSLLTDLDFSSLNHIYNLTNQAATWVTPANINVLGYVYPMINYHINYPSSGLAWSETWNVTDFFPAITVRKYIDTIFDSVDYTYSSDFFDSDFFGSLIVPFSSADFKITMTDVNDTIFKAIDPVYLGYGTTDTIVDMTKMYINSSVGGVEPTKESIRVTNDSTGGAYDVGNNYDASGSATIYEAPVDGTYNFEAKMKVQARLCAPLTAPTAVGNDGLWYCQAGVMGKLQIIRRYLSGWTGTVVPVPGYSYQLIGEQRFGIFPLDNAPGGTGVAPLAFATSTASVSATTPSNEYFYPSYDFATNEIIIDAQNSNSQCNEFTANATNIQLNGSHSHTGTTGCTVTAPGTGYVTSAPFPFPGESCITVTGSGTGLTVCITAVAGAITSAIMGQSPGTGYVTGDTVRVNSGNLDAILTLTINTVHADGDLVYLKWDGGPAQMQDYHVVDYPTWVASEHTVWVDSTGTEADISIYTNVHPERLTQLMNFEGSFKCTVSNVGLAEGELVDMDRTVPIKIKQKDFFMGIVKMFNLYVQTDTANDHNLLIEPRDDFFLDGTANVIDWSKKLDLSQPLESLPMGSLDSIDYLYTYKDDKDYYNALYKDTWDRTYGDKLYDEYINDFITKSHKTDIIFSPTPSVGQIYFDRVIPTIFKADNQGVVKRTQANIRILQYGGMKTTGQSWLHADIGSGTGGTFMNTYPYVGMYDDPYNPTEDIGFGLTREIYWDDHAGAITFSNNNLFNKYHRKFIEEITDKDSKVIKGWFYLTSSDIRALSFRKLYWFENAYFRLNKIENYNPQNPVTKCEFLKIKLADVFSPTTINTHGGLADIVNEPAPYYGNSTGTISGGNSVGSNKVSVLGINNSVSRSAAGVMIVGDGNSVFGGCKNIIIQGNDNIISAGVKNVSLLNTNDATVLVSGVSYVDGKKKGGIETIDTTTTADESVEIYLCDTSAGGFNVQLPTPSYMGQTWTIKSIDATNTLTIRASPYLIDGAGTQTLTTLYETKTIMWDGSTFHIISEF